MLTQINKTAKAKLWHLSGTDINSHVSISAEILLKCFDSFDMERSGHLVEDKEMIILVEQLSGYVQFNQSIAHSYLIDFMLFLCCNIIYSLN